MSEYLFDNGRVFDSGDHFDRATALGASFDIDIEHSPLRPGAETVLGRVHPLRWIGYALCLV